MDRRARECWRALPQRDGDGTGGKSDPVGGPGRQSDRGLRTAPAARDVDAISAGRSAPNAQNASESCAPNPSRRGTIRIWAEVPSDAGAQRSLTLSVPIRRPSAPPAAPRSVAPSAADCVRLSGVSRQSRNACGTHGSYDAAPMIAPTVPPATKPIAKPLSGLRWVPVETSTPRTHLRGSATVSACGCTTQIISLSAETSLPTTASFLSEDLTRIRCPAVTSDCAQTVELVATINARLTAALVFRTLASPGGSTGYSGGRSYCRVRLLDVPHPRRDDGARL